MKHAIEAIRAAGFTISDAGRIHNGEKHESAPMDYYAGYINPDIIAAAEKHDVQVEWQNEYELVLVAK